jgi:hypothetical protein
MKTLLFVFTLLTASTVMACSENKCASNADLISYIASNPRSYNDVVEEDVISKLATSAELTDLQLSSILFIFDSAKRGNGLDENAAILKVVDSPNMSQAQSNVLHTLISKASSHNDIVEDDIINELLDHDINLNLASAINSIILKARRSNGLHENDVLLKLIRSCPWK